MYRMTKRYKSFTEGIGKDIIDNKINKQIDVVIYLDVNEELATKRATGRLICNNCNKAYHKYFAEGITLDDGYKCTVFSPIPSLR